MNWIPEQPIRTSLEIGFADGKLSEHFLHLRGANWRSVPAQAELPYEDEQFQVVMIHESAFSRATVKEAHRVLKRGGLLFFTVHDRGKSDDRTSGFTLPEIYADLRDGFDIVGIERTPFWRLLTQPRVISIRAQKKNWRVLNNSYRPYVI